MNFDYREFCVDRIVSTFMGMIGETDPRIITEVHDLCATDPTALDYFAARAKTEYRPITTETTANHHHGETDMSLTVSETASGNFEPCPAGSYMARCTRLTDIGTQTSEFQGKTIEQKKVLLTWEVLDEDARRDDGEPFLLSKRYTASLHEKAALRKDLASWRGRDFTPEELAGFDLKAILGKECFLSVVHAEKDGRTFANIAAIMKLPKGANAPEGCGQDELLLWDMSAPDWAVFAKLPKRVVEQIEASPEFKALKPPASVPVGTAPSQSTKSGDPFEDMPDDLPF